MKHYGAQHRQRIETWAKVQQGEPTRSGISKDCGFQGGRKQDRHLENNTESWNPMGPYFNNLEGEMKYAILDWYLWIDDPQRSFKAGVRVFSKHATTKFPLLCDFPQGQWDTFHYRESKQGVAWRW